MLRNRNPLPLVFILVVCGLVLAHNTIGVGMGYRQTPDPFLLPLSALGASLSGIALLLLFPDEPAN